MMSSTLMGYCRREQNDRTKIHERIYQRRGVLCGQVFGDFETEYQIEASVQTHRLGQVVRQKAILADLSPVSLYVITVDSVNVGYAVAGKGCQPGSYSTTNVHNAFRLN
jgi:hypothetical protein